jgi:hypothetical protein
VRYLEGVGTVTDDKLADFEEMLAEVRAEQEDHADLYATLKDQQQARELDGQRAAEDASEEVLGRRGRGSAEDVLARAIARIGAGSYVPPAGAGGRAEAEPGPYPEFAEFTSLTGIPC